MGGIGVVNFEYMECANWGTVSYEDSNQRQQHEAPRMGIGKIAGIRERRGVVMP